LDIAGTLNQALQSHQNGELSVARRGYESVLKQQPDNLDALHLLGVLENQSGNADAAIALIGRAIEIQPTFAEAHNSLGNVFKDLENWDEAAACYGQAVKADPAFAGAHLNLGVAVRQQGDLNAALAHCDRAIEIDPALAAGHFNRGNALRELGRAEEAMTAYRDALGRDPAFADARGSLGAVLQYIGNGHLQAARWADAARDFREAIELGTSGAALHNNYGNALRNLGDTTAAIEQFGKALTADPKNAAAHNNLGNVLEDLGEPARAIEYYERALEARPDFAAALNNLGNALRAVDQADRAKERYRQALALDPSFLDAHFNLGHAYKETGDFADAQTSYEQVLKINPVHPGAWRHLASLGALPGDDTSLAPLEAELDRDGPSDLERAELAFALGKIHEDRGDVDKAFAMYQRGNAAKRRTMNYDVADDAAFFQRIKQTFTPAIFDIQGRQGHDGAAPIFIVGMPRSGTSLAEQILASHRDVFGAGELMFITDIAAKANYPEGLQDMGSDARRLAGADYMDQVRARAGGAARITDKMPHNFIYLDLIRQILPGARIVHCTRQPEATCLSLYKTLFTDRLEFAYDLAELGQYYGLYADLMAHWRRVLPGGFYDISYEALVTDQETETRRLLEYLDLPWDDACLSFHKTQRRVTTASNVQIRRALYSDALTAWRQFEHHLRPLFDALPAGPN